MELWKTAMDVWESWSEDQRKHFLSDKNLNTNYASHNWSADLPADITEAVMIHIETT